MQTVSRKSVPTHASELDVARAIQTAGTPERVAIEVLVGPMSAHVSEAQALSALLVAGATQVREAVINAQYAEYAAALDDDDRQYAAAVRARRDRLTD